MPTVPIRVLAERLGFTVRHALRLVKRNAARLGIEVQQGARNSVLIHEADPDRLIAAFGTAARGEPDNSGNAGGTDGAHAGFGYFYLIQLHPMDLPNRVKIGYTDNITQRLSDHRTAAPTLQLIRTWPCKRSWDRAAMDSVTRSECKSVGGEVFDGDVKGFLARAEAFFSVMPRPPNPVDEEAAQRNRVFPVTSRAERSEGRGGRREDSG
jgi:hypothetical protein